jgi:hypothetical protein
MRPREGICTKSDIANIAKECMHPNLLLFFHYAAFRRKTLWLCANGVRTLAAWCLGRGCNHQHTIDVTAHPGDGPV